MIDDNPISIKEPDYRAMLYRTIRESVSVCLDNNISLEFIAETIKNAAIDATEINIGERLKKLWIK